MENDKLLFVANLRAYLIMRNGQRLTGLFEKYGLVEEKGIKSYVIPSVAECYVKGMWTKTSDYPIS